MAIAKIKPIEEDFKIELAADYLKKYSDDKIEKVVSVGGYFHSDLVIDYITIDGEEKTVSLTLFDFLTFVYNRLKFWSLGAQYYKIRK